LADPTSIHISAPVCFVGLKGPIGRANRPAEMKGIVRLLIARRDPSKDCVWVADTAEPLQTEAALRGEMVRGVVARMYEAYPLPKKP